MAGVCAPTLEPNAHVVVDDTRRFQTLVGIGAAVAYVNAEVVEHPRKEALFDAMFSDTGFEILRLRNEFGLDEDMSHTAEIVRAATDRLGHAPTILMNSASPPPSLKANGSNWCEGNPEDCTLITLDDGSFDYAGLASHWRASLEAYSAVGIEPDYISIQNNPNCVPAAGAANEACRLLPAEGTETVSVGGEDVSVEYAGYAEALDAVVAEIDDLEAVPQILAPETTNPSQVAEYAAALDFDQVDVIAHHMYGVDPTDLDIEVLTAVGELAEEQGRPLFQSEMSGDPITTAVLLHASLAIEGAAAFVNNGFIESAGILEPTNTALINLTEDDFVLGDPYHVMLHYSAHIAPGWVRVGADSDTEDVLASAWVSPDDGAMVLVLTNPGRTTKVVRLDTGTGDPAGSSVTRTTLNGVERSTELGALPADGSLSLPSRSMVTVVLER